MLHPLIRWLARRGIRWFYRNVEILGAGNIPATGPTLMVASHGNDLTDILLAFMVSKRDVLFVANIAAADSPLVRWTFAGLGVIPVARTRDARALLSRGENVAAINDRAFADVTTALKAGHMVAIFPEGVVNDLPHLAPLRTGAARMALDAIADGVDELQLVAVGFQYESPRQSRSDVLAVVGDPTRVSDWRATENNRAVPEFTRFIRHRLLQVTRSSATWADAQQLSAFAAAIGAVTHDRNESALAASHRAQRTITEACGAELFSVTKMQAAAARDEHERAAATINLAEEIAPGPVSRRHTSKPDAIVNVWVDAAALTSCVVKWGANPWSAIDYASMLSAAGHSTASPADVSAATVTMRPADGLAAARWMLAPIAAFGWLWHGVPFWGAVKLAAFTKPLPEESAGRIIVPGLYVVEVWYVILPLLLLRLGAKWWLVLVLFIAQPRLGDFAFQWRDRYRAQRLISRVHKAPANEGAALLQAAQKLRRSWRDLSSISIPKS